MPPRESSLPVADLSEIRLRSESVGAGVRLGLALFAAGELYVAATTGQPHRPLLAAVFALLALSALLVARAPAEEIVRSRRREVFFLGWSVWTLSLITAAVALDGGTTSPLSLLFFVPVVYAALSYPPISVVVVGALSEIAVVAVGVTGHDSRPVPLAFFAGSIAMVAVMCAWQGHQQECRRRELDHLSRSDPLTGCLNRRGFEERLDSELDAALRGGRPLASTARRSRSPRGSCSSPTPTTRWSTSARIGRSAPTSRRCASSSGAPARSSIPPAWLR